MSMKKPRYKKFTAMVITLTMVFFVFMSMVPQQVHAEEFVGPPTPLGPAKDAFSKLFPQFATQISAVPEVGIPVASIGDKIRSVIISIGDSLIHLATSGAKI